MSLFLRQFINFKSTGISSLLNVKHGLLLDSRLPLNVLKYQFQFQARNLLLSSFRLQSSSEVEAEANDGENQDSNSKSKIDPSKDHTRKIPVEVSLRYIESQAYKETYGDEPVWKSYRRNHKFQFPPRKTRKTCVRKGVISTGSPCPICRDEYLVPDYRNTKLLRQFISPYTDDVIDAYTTGVCRKKQFELEVAIEKAKDYGYIEFHVPKRIYNYEDYYPQWNDSKSKSSK